MLQVRQVLMPAGGFLVELQMSQADEIDRNAVLSIFTESSLPMTPLYQER